MGGIQIIKSTRGKRPYVWFIFSWENTETKGRYIDLEGFFWTNNQGFATKVSSTPDPADMQARANELENYFHQIQMRAPLESPPEPGFCFRNAYFPGEPTKGSSEHISLHASFPSNPDVFIRFSTGTVGTAMAHSPNLVERFEHTSNRFLNELAGIRLLRLRPRMVGPYPGDVKVERIREGNRTVGYSFLWRCLGQADSAVMPKLELEMVTGHGDPPVNSSLRRRDAMAL